MCISQEPVYSCPCFMLSDVWCCIAFYCLEAAIFRNNHINILVANGQAPYSRISAAIVFSIQNAHALLCLDQCKMTSSNGNILRVTGHLCGEFTGPRWIPHTKASDAELWCFLWSAPELKVEETVGEAGDLRRHRAHYDVIVMDFDWYIILM